LILETGKCDVNCMVEDEDSGTSGTPLTYALSGTRDALELQEICELLLKHGAKVCGLYNSSGEDAIQIAKRKYPSIVPLLEEASKNQQ